MTRAESAAPAVLTREAHRRAFEKERSKGERFGVMPFVGTARFKNFTPSIQHILLNFRDDFEVFRHARESIDDLLQHLGADRGRLAFRGVMRLKDRGRFLEARFVGGFLGLDRFYFLQDNFEPHLEFSFEAPPLSPSSLPLT